MTNETKARSALMEMHRQVCFENGDHPDEVDTPYSVGADAITRADLSDAKDARIAELEAELTQKIEQYRLVGMDKINLVARVAELEARNRELALEVMSSSSQAHDAYERQKELKAKLTKAVDALERIAHASNVYGVESNAEDQGADTLAYAHKSTCNLALATLAELKGTE